MLTKLESRLVSAMQVLLRAYSTEASSVLTTQTLRHAIRKIAGQLVELRKWHRLVLAEPEAKIRLQYGCSKSPPVVCRGLFRAATFYLQNRLFFE